MFRASLFVFSVFLSFHAYSAELTIYSVRSEGGMRPLLDRFTAETGIQTKFVGGTHPELMAKLQAEGKSTPADVFITKDLVYQGEATRLGVFQPFASEIVEKNIPGQFIEPARHWYLLSYRARVIMYNVNKVNPAELSTYKGLGDSQWAGRLCVRTAQNSYNHGLFASFVHNLGFEPTVAVLKSWMRNLATPPIATDTDVLKAIAAGQCDVGVTNTYYLAFLLEKDSSFPVRPFFPEQGGVGAHVNGGGIGIVKHSRNVDAATKFLEFMSRSDVQTDYASPHHEYPANPSSAPTDIVRTFGPFRADAGNIGVISTNSDLGVKAATEAGYN
ncbi:MAG: extracellular solute-binding protein [Calothrix sp. SM1_5_4]|nr:extracellular solute-binding protein [Calothrix sp. SM1_5_4]